MAKELDAILDHGEANHAASCITESGSVSFLEQIICPIYQTIAAVSGTDYQLHLGKFWLSHIIAEVKLNVLMLMIA